MPRTPAQVNFIERRLRAVGCNSIEEFQQRMLLQRAVAESFGDRYRAYARWQIEAASALRRNRNLNSITHPLYGTVRTSRTADMAPYVLPNEQHLFEAGPEPIPLHRQNTPQGRRALREWRAALRASQRRAPRAPVWSTHGAGLWGKGGRCDYWAAKKRGEVDGPEERAVTLLFEICDHYRANQYLATGLMAAVGNLTGRTYIVSRTGSTQEIVGGRVAYSWCIHPNEGMPPTDRVIGLKNLIEGEEALFRKTGNRSIAGQWYRPQKLPPALMHQSNL